MPACVRGFSTTGYPICCAASCASSSDAGVAQAGVGKPTSSIAAPKASLNNEVRMAEASGCPASEDLRPMLSSASATQKLT